MKVGETEFGDGAAARPAAALPRRRLTSRIGLSHVVAITSGVLAFVLILSWMRAQDEVVEVAVATQTIRSGSVVRHEVVDFVEVPAGGDLTAALLSPDEAYRLGAAVATRQIAPGEPLLDSDLRPVDAPTGLRAMSVPADPARAAGGELAVGDRVDVIGFAGPTARYVATDLEVLDVPGSPAGTFGATTSFAVTVAVDETQALAIATALQVDDLHVVRSTGAPQVIIETPGTASVGDDVIGDDEEDG